MRLLEEPQAAFYCWLERHDLGHEFWGPDDRDAELRHALVIDIGGGTSDFSLFELRRNKQSPIPDIRRVAVSEHILLGGDNVDLAIAHFIEPRLAGIGGKLPARNGTISLPPVVNSRNACWRRQVCRMGGSPLRCPVAGRAWSPDRRWRQCRGRRSRKCC